MDISLNMLNVLLIFQLSICLSFAGEKKCDIYTCKPQDQTWFPNQCRFIDNTTNIKYYQECSDSSFDCELDQDQDFEYNNYNCTCQNINYLPNNYPGLMCRDNDDCLDYRGTVTCVNGICRGISNGGACRKDKQCNPGLYCNYDSEICVPQIQIGQSGCTSDYECVNNALCNIFSDDDPSQNTCLGFRSLKVHDEVGECDGHNYLCPYDYCARNSDRKYYCTDLLYTLNGAGSQCDVNAPGCFSNADPFFDPPFFIEGTCYCGYNGQGYAYCEALAGDKVLQGTYWNILNEWVSSPEILNCNTQARFDSWCVKTYWNAQKFAEFNYYEQSSLSYPFIIGAPDCVINDILPDYVRAKNAFMNSSVEVAA